MNLRQLQYAVWLSESGSFSQLAEKLNITQPALSKQILSLEKELGVQLFIRSGSPMKITVAGEYFIKQAKELLYKEDQLLRSMEQFRSGDKGELIIGITPFRSAYLIPSIVKKVRDRFPGVRVKLVEEGSEQLRKDAADGKFDFAVINMPVDEAILNVRLIEPDRLALVLPDELVSTLSETADKSEIDFNECQNTPFIVLGTNQEMRILFEKLCVSCNVNPPIAAEAVNMTTAWEMACHGVAATLLPLQFINSITVDRKLTVIPLKNNIQLRQPAIVTKHGQYISPYAEYAIRLLTGNKED